MSNIVIGVDNGATGSVGIMPGDGTAIYYSMPTKEAVHYTKAGKVVTRVDVQALTLELEQYRNQAFAYIERPFTGSAMMINTALLAARAHEAVMIALEGLGIGYTTIDSREWQRAMLPGVKGSPELKKASRLRGIQLYPHLQHYIELQGDADGLLIAHYYANAR